MHKGARLLIGGLLTTVLVTGSVRGGEGNLSLIAKGIFTTGSQLFPNPNAVDPIVRAQSVEFKGFFGLGFEVKYHFPGTSLALGLSVDHIVSTQSQPMVASNRVAVPTEDGFVLIPLELTGYFLIPITDGPFNVFMGGGGGIYWGKRNYSIAGVTADSQDDTPGYGIHVVSGVSYRFTEFFSLYAEMKFRDAQFEATNAFPQSRVTYQQTIVAVSQTPFASSFHVDGMVLQIGVAISF